MGRRLGRYFWKLFLVNAALMALVLAGSVWVIMSQFDRLHEKELSRHLAAQAAALEVVVRDRFDRAHAGELNTLAQEVGSTELESVRVTFVLADGTVVGDSEAEPGKMESHADRPEIRAALETGSGESVRWSHTVAMNMNYVAVRVGPADDPRGVVRVSMALQRIAAQAQPAQRLTLALALIAAGAAVLLAMGLALLWSRRIQRITVVARNISRGDLSARVKVWGNDEVALLGRSLNEMRERLATQLETIDRQHRTLDSLISQLREGVVVVDGEGCVVLINSEAIELLQGSLAQPDGAFLGQPVERCVPQRKLQDLLCPAHQEGTPDVDHQSSRSSDGTGTRSDTVVQELELRLVTGTGSRSVLARAFDVRLPGVSTEGRPTDPGTHIGRALLLTDVTELTRVMQVKADLAANASHELRTPLSAIRAAVETLRSVDWESDPKAASRFIDVVDRHSGRMEAMIGDLLALSRLESGAVRFDATQVSAKALFEELHTSFEEALSKKRLRWQTTLPDDDVMLTTSPELLRMILRNLIDNAIRFTDPDGNVELSVCADGGGVTFQVADTGCGMTEEQQQRVFERFYQVEPSRSGSERGTGLGLSIVRHAVAAMNAQIDLQSAPGQGTRVTIRILSRT